MPRPDNTLDALIRKYETLLEAAPKWGETNSYLTNIVADLKNLKSVGPEEEKMRAIWARTYP